MGVRISIYAVDVPKFEAFVQQLLVSVLWYYADYGPATNQSLHFYGELNYSANHEYGVSAWKDQKRRKLRDRSEIPEPLLAQTLRDYLTREESITLLSVLGCLSQCVTVDWCKEITRGYRRWWIGSFLDYLDRVDWVNRQDYLAIAELVQKVLRPYDCGKALPKKQYELGDFTFPIKPASEPDYYMGVWTASEAQFAMLLIRELLEEHEPRFTAPPDTSDDGTDWNEWVHKMLNQLYSIANLTYDNLAVVSFIT
jgi:hypothetical protein